MRVRAVPLACWICAALALGNGVAWATITPMFQTPDEENHFGYTQYFAETGKLPTIGPEAAFSVEQGTAFGGIPFSIEGRPTWFAEQSRDLRHQLAKPLRRSADGEAGAAVNNPPLYYVLEALPYRAAYSANALDRLYVMRLFSALLAALTVALCFGFVRELLPGTPWAWSVGGLAVAFQPLFGFMSGGVNSDDGVYACGAALLFLLARAFRRGLTLPVGVGIGAASLAGVLTKGSMFGLLPGAALGLVLVVWRTPKPQRRRALVAAGAALGVLVLPFALWIYANHNLFGRNSATTTSGLASGEGARRFVLRQQISYTWQFFLPRLPFMTDQFLGYPSYPLWESYFQGFIGRFGWFQFGFPIGVSWLALGIYSGILGLAGTALVRCRAAMRGRWGELLCYASVAGGLLLEISAAGYRYKLASGSAFEQTRYLLPLLPLYAGLVAVAARGAGRKWGQTVGVLLVVIAMGHSLFSMLLTIGRYYA